MLISQLEAHLNSSDINITLTKVGDVITAIVLPKPKNDKIKDLSPIIAKGTAAELDAGLATALKSTFAIIAGFKVENTEVVESELKEASQPKQTVKKPADKVKTTEMKPNDKVLFSDAQKLFKEGKYTEALPLYQSAAELKPDSKQYQEALKLCQSWVNRLKDADMFLDSSNSQEVEKGIEIIKESETIPETQEEELLTDDAQAEKEMSESEIMLNDDEDDFPL